MKNILWIGVWVALLLCAGCTLGSGNMPEVESPGEAINLTPAEAFVTARDDYDFEMFYFMVSALKAPRFYEYFPGYENMDAIPSANLFNFFLSLCSYDNSLAAEFYSDADEAYQIPVVYISEVLTSRLGPVAFDPEEVAEAGYNGYDSEENLFVLGGFGTLTGSMFVAVTDVCVEAADRVVMVVTVYDMDMAIPQGYEYLTLQIDDSGDWQLVSFTAEWLD